MCVYVCIHVLGFGLASKHNVSVLLDVGYLLCVVQIVCRTDVGLGEAYMAGDYLVDDLGGFMALMVRQGRPSGGGQEKGGTQL
jgi:hypothetical protein